METTLLQLTASGLSTGSIYALTAIGLNIIFKSTGALNFAQGEWVMLGGMLAALAYKQGPFPVWMACLLATLAVAGVGLLTERGLIRKLPNAAPFTLTLVSVGISLVTKSLVMLSLGKSPVGIPGLSHDASLNVAGAYIQVQSVWIVGLTLMLMLATQLFFGYTRFGVAMRAAAANPEAAALMGISNARIVCMAFVLAAAVGGLAGTIITPMTLMSYDSGAMLGFKGFSAAVLGGLGNLPGSLLGGWLLGLLESFTGGYVTSQFKDAVAFFVLLAILVLRPNGLLNRAAINKV